MELKATEVEQKEQETTLAEQVELKTKVEPVELRTTESQEAMVEQRRRAQRVGLKNGFCYHKREHREF